MTKTLRAVMRAAAILVAAAVSSFQAAPPAAAQSGPNPALYYGFVPTPAQWTSFFTQKQDYLGFAPLNPGGLIGIPPVTVTLFNITNAQLGITNGTSVLNPGTGTLEYVLPVQTVTGASVTSYSLFSKYRRSNGGSAMSDTLPAASTVGLVNGSRLAVGNIDATATLTLTAGAGTTINATCAQVPAGREVVLVYDLANTAWRFDANTCGMLINAVSPTPLVSLGGALTTAAALTTTGAGAATLAFGSTAATYNFPSVTTDTVALLGIANIFTANQSLTTAPNGVVSWSITNSNNGTAAEAVFLASNGAGIARFGFAGTGYTTVPLVQNRAYVRGNSSTAGVVIDAAGASPIIFGVSDAEVGRWDSATPGQLDLGVSTVTGGALLMYGATSGSLVQKCAATCGTGSAITWPAGTTNFSATGGTSQVLQQASAGAAITVGQLAASNLSNGTTGSGGGVVLATSPSIASPALTGTVTGTNAIPLTVLANQSANVLLGTTTAGAVQALTINGGASCTNALTWTNGTGFGCNSLAGSGTVTAAAWGLVLGGAGSTLGVATTNPPYGFDAPVNLSLTASVGSNILTVTVTGNNGSTPSATNPVLIPFPDVTLANGDPVWVAVTSALSINTNATGATLGSQNSVPFRFWIAAFNNGGTAVLALFNCSSVTSTTTQIYPPNEHTLQSTAGISGSATGVGNFYTPNGTALTNKAFRIIGMLEYASGLTTAGTYASAPTIVRLVGPGTKKCGDIVQGPLLTSSTTEVDTTSTTPAAALSGSITPTSTANLIRIRTSGSGSQAAGLTTGFLTIVRGTSSGTKLLGALQKNSNAAATFQSEALETIDLPTGGGPSYTYTITTAGDGTHAVSYCVTATGNQYCEMTLEEIQG